jgi:hypothetical protein
MVQPGSIDFREIILVDRPQVYALDFRCQCFSRWSNGDAGLSAGF